MAVQPALFAGDRDYACYAFKITFKRLSAGSRRLDSNAAFQPPFENRSDLLVPVSTDLTSSSVADSIELNILETSDGL